MELMQASMNHLPDYADALRRGWSPDNIRGAVAAEEELERIGRDPQLFVNSCTNLAGGGDPVVLPDGSQVPRLPGIRLWMWDGEFCGAIGFRWQAGTAALPPWCLGHIGYSVVPWKRRRGYATRALGMVLARAKRQGMAYVEITTDLDNIASQRVIVRNAGFVVGQFCKPLALGGKESLRYRIALT